MRNIPSEAGEVTVSATSGSLSVAMPLNESDVHIRLPSSVFQRHGEGDEPVLSDSFN